MEAEEVVYLLEQHWTQLKDDLGDDWPDFEAKYRILVASLPADSKAVPERTVTSLCDLLDSYPAGDNLLKIDLPDEVLIRLAQTANKVLNPVETVQHSISNRLRELPDRSTDNNATKQQPQVTASPTPTPPHA